MRFSLVRFSFVRNFKTTPKYLVHADFTFYGSESPSFVRKRWILKEKTVSGWIEENGPPFFPQILNREWWSHLPMKVKVPRK